MAKVPAPSRAELEASILRLAQDPVAFAEAIGLDGDRTSGPLDPERPWLGYARKRFGWVHRELVDNMLGNIRASGMVPRNHGKSTLLVAMAAHDLVWNPDARILYASAARDLATKMVGDIRRLLHGTIKLHPSLPAIRLGSVFPHAVPASDPNRQGPCEHFSIQGKAGIGREPSIFVASVRTNLAGVHPNRAYIDDPVNEQNSGTAMQRERVVEFVYQLEPMMYDHASPIRHMGTPWALDDAGALLGEKDGWNQVRYGCWDGHDEGSPPGPDGRFPLCPSFMTADELLARQAAVSPTFWAAQFLCDPIPSDAALFERPMLDAATDHDLTLERLPPAPEILLWDPTAATKDTPGDWNGLIVVRCYAASDLGYKGFDPPNTTIFVPVLAHEIKRPLDEAAAWIETLAHERRATLREVWVEEVAAQSVIVPWMEERRRLAGVRVRGQSIPAKALRFRLQAIPTALRKGRLVFPPSFPGRNVLFERLLSYPKGKSDDLPSALSLLSGATSKRTSPVLPKVSENIVDRALDYGTTLWHNDSSSRPTRI